ncbi:hypothetical protein XU18_5228 [Perkinsela sp. CCAP 1560/4]|nr:hypothetical protein XU18_5228 [Perkinsela sp. CCAP 1560/4]|eukprot:KNH00551.1 hypothetical protein XU18_5228 [Perkinsela sp. CCAP 1560/4]
MQHGQTGAYEKLYEEGRLEGYKIGMAERIAQVQAWKIAIIAGSGAVGAMFFSFCLFRFRSTMQHSAMEIKQLKRAIAMKEHEIATTRSQKTVLQTSRSHQLLSFSQQKSTMQNDLQKLMAGNYLLLENVQKTKRAKTPHCAASYQLQGRIKSGRLKNREYRKISHRQTKHLFNFRALAIIYACVGTILIASFP